MQRMKLITACCLLLASQIAFAQTDIKNWYQRDPQKDTFYGISLTKTYDALKGKKSTPVIVAVIDSGIDTTQEDLRSVLWTNPGEIPGNGIDDDHNGYIDDIHGWNFLGNKDGSNLKKDVDERTRVYYRFKEKFDGRTIDTTKLTVDEKWQYREWQKAAQQMNINPDEKMEVMMLGILAKSLKKNDAVIREEMGKDAYTRDELEKFEPQSQKGKQAKMGFITCLKMLNVDDDQTNQDLIRDLDEYVEGKETSIQTKTTAPPDYRAQTVKDNYYEIEDKYYGNNNIMGPDPMHGTHVSGIIAAARNNNIGIDGIADNVQIMMVRALLDGDEYDKDIALAIVYAVNNGAKVINMSFGKSFSPEKKWVDEAIRYAESKDVLLIHAAGNESHDVDHVDNYPNQNLITFNRQATNFINVGASGDPRVASGQLVADFSNYGKSTVDVFAPGVKIYSTLPGGNKYGYLSGTSMAAPVVTGVAALIRSYYPDLTAQQVKYAIDKSVDGDPDTKVNVPGTDSTTTLRELCETGGFLNAYNALEIASTLKAATNPDNKTKHNKEEKPVFINSNDTKTKN